MTRTLTAVCLLALPKAAGVVAVAGVGALVVGCSDDSQPEYWIKKLDDPAARPTAIKRLTQFFEDAMTKANGNREAPEVKALLDKIVGPMSKAYVSGDLDEKTRVDLLKALANTRAPGAKDAIVKAIGDFAAGKATPEEMKQASLYVKQLKLKEAAGPMLDAFLKTNAGDPKQGGLVYKEEHDAMVAIADPSWKAKLLDTLNRPINTKEPIGARSEIFWQTTAAEVLGDLRAPDAVRPLFKMVLTPEKADMAATAIVALTKIGKPAIPQVIDILNGKDDEMVQLAKAQAGGDASRANAYVSTAALVLGTIGRGEALSPMTAALNRADNDMTRAVIGREMSKLPSSVDSIHTFETVFEKVSPSTLIPPGDPARVVMGDAASSFMDASMVPWLLKQVREAKGSAEEKDSVQSALLQTALKLMKKDQIDQVKPLIDSEGGPVEKDAFKQASDVTNACGENVGCYLAKLEDPATQEKKLSFTAVKAAYMLGMVGNESTKPEIASRLKKIKNADARFAAIKAIDHLSPKGDTKTADTLQKMVDDDLARGDASGDAPIRQMIPRLRARAES